MKLVTKIGLCMTAVSVLFFNGCNDTAPSAKVERTEAVVKPTISEQSLGLRKVDLYSEDSVKPEETKYSKEYAGSGYKINRAFQDAPPMIPHDVEGMLPITINDNQCTSCHMPEVAPSMGATAIPESHFTDFRPKHKFDGKKFEKSIDNNKNEISIKKIGDLAGARFNCSQCHAPQSEGQLVENTFTPEYTHKDGAEKSSWSGSKLTEGLDTLMK
ncbi:nitrate reductase cytochrome c-type subunit [Sulfurimonas sp.]|uniref:nitrate reductase cytochrome c-type subunit n=1 Tax=Sulfurimonas sp. TaxID=2022749 RepID=UPI0035671D45